MDTLSKGILGIDLRAFVAVSVFGIFGFVVIMLLTRPMPLTDQAGTLLLTIVGAVLAMTGSIVQFYFGSTKDSKEKDSTAQAQAQTIATMAAATPAGPAAVLGPPERVISPAPVTVQQAVGGTPAPTVLKVDVEGGSAIETLSDGTFRLSKDGKQVGVFPSIELARAAIH